MPYRLSAFSDEISPDIQLQIDGLAENGIGFCCMRGVNGKNVLDLEDFQANLASTQFRNRGIRFSALATLIGAGALSTPLEPELERLRKAARLARLFETRVVRVFTFCLPPEEAPAAHRGEVLRRMKALAGTAKAEGVNLEIENTQGQYGGSATGQLEILEHIGSGHVRAAFDFVSFVKAGEEPLKAWELLRKHVVDFHVSDWRGSSQFAVQAGSGDGRVREILQDAFASNWAGFVTLKPCLDKTPEHQGQTGAQLFQTVAQALKTILAEVGAK